MAYEVTATRRRPKTFDELAGQEFVAATLKNSLETGRIAHAYLFSGPRGCGKTSAARILARSLNCEKGPTAIPCGVCSNCIEISRGASLDVIEIDGASNTGVNDVRQIKDEVLFPPNSGRYKVYIIDEVHMLSTNAFNALLKTIEEPPPYIVFIFATTELHKVPATIKSRCQQFNFRLIALETIAAILRDTCVEMGIEAEEEALVWIAKESTGSMRDAYTLFDQVASFSGGYITSALIREKLGLVGLDMLNSLAEACILGNTAAAFNQTGDILSNGVSIEQFVIDFAEYYHNILFIKAGITRESILGYSPSRFSANVLGALDPIRIEEALDMLLRLYRDIKISLSPRFELELVIARLCSLTQWVSPLELRNAITAARESLERGVPAGGPSFQAPPPGSYAETTQPGENRADTGTQPEQREGPARNVPGAKGSLVEGFDRYMAQRGSENGGEAAEDRRPHTVQDSNILPTLSGNVPKPAMPGMTPELERVLRIFPGIIVENKQNNKETRV
jgi:DNA polymerase-3 subunit gamma/tau